MYLLRTLCSKLVWQSGVPESLLSPLSLLLMYVCSSWKGILTERGESGLPLPEHSHEPDTTKHHVRGLCPSPLRFILPPLLYRGGSPDSERLSNRPKVTQLARGRAGIAGQAPLTLITPSAHSPVTHPHSWCHRVHLQAAGWRLSRRPNPSFTSVTCLTLDKPLHPSSSPRGYGSLLTR